MRRSRSFSNIPLPKFRRHPSSENLATSRNSQQGLRRSTSSTNLLSVPRPSHLSDSRFEYNNENDLLASNSKHASRRIAGTPLRTVGSISRRFTATPVLSRLSSASKPMRSPSSVPLTTSKINDKKFSSDQYRKICMFLENRMEDFDPKTLKPLSLATFVQTMSILFNEIDPRIKFTMANYKEVVFKYLKLFKYPGPVSMSLLKSVNTNISWAQVMCIFGWLVDVINGIKPADDENNLLDKYILGRARHDQFRMGAEVKGVSIQDIEQMLNLDRNEVEILEKECEMLKHDVENKKTLITEQKQKKIALAEKLEKMKSDIKEFKEDNLEEKYKNEIMKWRKELEIRELKIEEVKQFIQGKRQVISSQRYSLKDKQELLKKLEDENYSLVLKREELENIYKLKCDYDYQQTDCRRQIENKIYEINGKLLQLQLQLGNFIDESNNIRLPDRGLHSPTFLKELEEKIQLLENIGKNVDLELKKVQDILITKRNECNEVSVEVDQMKMNIDSLKKQLEKTDEEKSRVLFELDIIKKNAQIDMARVKETAPDVESIKKKNIELQKEVLILKDKMDSMSEQSLKLCEEIYSQTQSKALKMKSIMKDMKEKAIAAYEKKVLLESEIDELSKVDL